MTALLETPVGALDVSLLEERQPEVPLTCTDKGTVREPRPECGKPAQWEGMCMGCGRIFRRCQPHYEDEVAWTAEYEDGSPFACAQCGTYFYLAQFVRIR